MKYDTNWNLLKFFLAVRETHSLVEAAKLLGVSHTTVFRQMSTLEQEMGTRLFDRIKGRYVLTEAGHEMEQIARDVAQSFDTLDRRLMGHDDAVSGLIRLTTPVSFANSSLPRYLTEFNELYPEIHIEMLVSNVEESIADRQADVALRVSNNPPENLWGRRVIQIGWSVFASVSYLQRNVPLEVEADLMNHKVIAPAGRLCQHPVFETLLSSGQSFTALATDDLTAMGSLAIEGAGVAILPDDIQREGLVKCFTYQQAFPNQLWILTHNDLKKVNRISLLMRYIAEKFRYDPYWIND